MNSPEKLQSKSGFMKDKDIVTSDRLLSHTMGTSFFTRITWERRNTRFKELGKAFY